MPRSTTKMLHVPFSLLREREIDSDTLSILARKYHLPDHLAKVLHGKRFRTPSDILRDSEIRAAASPQEFLKLTVSPKSERMPVDPEYGVVAINALRPEGTELAAHLWTLTDNSHRLVLSSADSDLISVAIDGDGEPDPATIKLGGFWWWEWPKLGRDVKELIYRRLVDNRVQLEVLKLARMSPDAQPRIGPLVAPIRKIAQLIVFFRTATGTASAAGALADGGTVGPGGVSVPGGLSGSTVETGDIYDPGGMDPGEYPPSDQCSLSPDWPFARCCVAHDYCYLENARGCDECARLQCDLDFLRCMLNVAGANVALQEMALVYFMAVRAFGDVGDSTFQYCGSARGAGGVNLNKLLIAGALVVGAVVGIAVGGLLGVLVGVGTAAVLVGVIGRLMCEMCEQIEEWVEECEADRIRREESCERRKKKCKKKKHWWQKLLCYVSYFWHCVVVDILIKGACWLLKKVQPALC